MSVLFGDVSVLGSPVADESGGDEVSDRRDMGVTWSPQRRTAAVVIVHVYCACLNLPNGYVPHRREQGVLLDVVSASATHTD